MSNNRVGWWNTNKLKLALIPALAFWITSMLCFVFGLSFQNPVGVLLGKWDISIWIAIMLSLGNTIIQIIGNDQEAEKLGPVLTIGWYASYALGVGSNVNALLSILHINSVGLEWVICISLGSMIEVMPEKLLVMFLKSMDGNQYSSNQSRHNQSSRSYRGDFRPAYQNLPKAPSVQTQPIQRSAMRPAPKPKSNVDTGGMKVVTEPTYHPMSYEPMHNAAPWDLEEG